MTTTHPTPEYRAWVDATVARLAPHAAALRADPSRGAQNRAAALETIVSDLRARAAGSVPTTPDHRPPTPISTIAQQADLFL